MWEPAVKEEYLVSWNGTGNQYGTMNMESESAGPTQL